MSHALLLPLLFLAEASLADLTYLHMANDPQVRAFFAYLVKESGFGLRDTEEAAFVVVDGDGGYRFVRWRSTLTHQSSTFQGVIPSGTVAIVHTHPRLIPAPSRADQQTAARLVIPIFVLTPQNIYLVTCTGANVPIVENQRWLFTAAESPLPARVRSAARP